MEQPIFLTPAEVASRWGMSCETIRKHARQGLLRPAMGRGRGTRYALAEVQAIEQRQGWGDFVLVPLAWVGRGSPAALLGRVVFAREAVEVAADHGAEGFAAVTTSTLAVLALIEGDALPVVPRPVRYPGEVGTVSLQDKQAGQDLVHLAHAALWGLLRAECRATLADLGPKMRERITSELQRILAAVDGKA